MSGSIRIVSKRKGGVEPVPGETIVDVDRTHAVLGNRHVLTDHRDAKERARVISAYATEFAGQMADQGPMWRAVSDLAARFKGGERIALRCWCAPRPCHAEIIQAKIYELAGIAPQVGPAAQPEINRGLFDA